MVTPNRDPLPTQALEQPGFLFTDIARLYRIALDRRMRRFRLTRSQSWLISFLCYFEGSSQQQLADLMGTGKGGIGKLIERLEQKGLVRRDADLQDSRSKRVYLGERIKPLTQEMGREIDDLVNRSLRELEGSEVVVLKRWLGTIRASLLEEKDRKV